MGFYLFLISDREIFFFLLQVKKALTYEKFISWTKLDRFCEVEVQVYLPRFTLEESYNMEGILQNLGMTDAFNAACADFTGMSSG